jgi:hypothetical protein
VGHGDPVVWTITEMSGSEQTLLEFSSVRLNPSQTSLRFSALMTLHRVVVPRRSKRAANFALRSASQFRPSRMASSGGECAPGVWLVAGDAGSRRTKK